MSQPNREQVAAAVAAYFESIGTADTAAFVALFTPDVHFEDPVGTAVLTGHEGAARFLKGTRRAWASLSMAVKDVIVRGERAAVRWAADGQSASGRRVAFAGIDVLTVTSAGKIARVEGYWDIEGVVAQM